MTDLQGWINTAIAALTPIILIWRINEAHQATMRVAGSAEKAAIKAEAAAVTAVVEIKDVAMMNTNGLKDQLVETIAKASRAEGFAEGLIAKANGETDAAQAREARAQAERSKDKP